MKFFRVPSMLWWEEKAECTGEEGSTIQEYFRETIEIIVETSPARRQRVLRVFASCHNEGRHAVVATRRRRLAPPARTCSPGRGDLSGTVNSDEGWLVTSGRSGQARAGRRVISDPREYRQTSGLVGLYMQQLATSAGAREAVRGVHIKNNGLYIGGVPLPGVPARPCTSLHSLTPIDLLRSNTRSHCPRAFQHIDVKTLARSRTLLN